MEKKENHQSKLDCSPCVWPLWPRGVASKKEPCSRFWKEDREGREFNSSPNKSSILEEKWSRHAKSHNSSVSETPSDAAPRPQKP